MNRQTSVLAFAVLGAAFFSLVQGAAAFNEKNNNEVTNTHNHLKFGDYEGGIEEIQSNSKTVHNDANEHLNTNYNSERSGDSEKVNSHGKGNDKND
jgi:hypothetical protein